MVQIFKFGSKRKHPQRKPFVWFYWLLRISVHLTLVFHFTMLTIKRSDVPLYLREGSFFESLDAQDDNAFDVPTDCFKDVASVESEPDLVFLLQTVRYWGLSVTPVEVFEYIIDNGRSDDYAHLLYSFPELTSYLRSVLKLKETPASDRVDAAILAGLDVSNIRMLRQKGYAWSETACESAAQMNDLECLMYLHTEGCPWDKSLLLGAVGSNSLPCLQYALDFGEFDAAGISEAMNTAATSGYIECMRVLQGAGAVADVHTTLLAVASNQLESVKYLHSQGCEFPERICANAVQWWGNVEMLRFLHEEVGAELTGTLQAAAEHGRIECLQYAHLHGEAWHPNVCMLAARGGHLHCLRYAHEHGCPWKDDTAQAAVSARSWGCFMYALWHGCGWVVHIFMAFSFYFVLPMYLNANPSGPVKYTMAWWRETSAGCAFPFLILLMFYRKHFGKYLSARNADRLVQSYFCVVLICGTVDCILEASWPMVLLRLAAFVSLVGALVFVNTRHVVFGTLPANSPHWYQFHHN